MILPVPRATRRASMRPVVLPADERPHPDRAMEWWYFVGHLKPAGRPEHPGFTVGFIVLRAWVVLEGAIGLVLFVDHENGVRPLRQAQQLLHRTFAPHGENGFRFEFGRLDASRSWSIEASEDLHYSLRLREEGQYLIDLDLRSGPAYRLGVEGIVDYGQQVELAYYVRPHLWTTGRLRPDGAEPIDVEGHMWLERQWGDEDVTAVQWKYLLIHVSPQEQWIFFRLRHRRGARTETRFGCRMTNGQLERVAPDEIQIDDTGDVAGVPVRTRVRVASRHLDLRIEPLFEERQYYRPDLVPPFFEGASRVRGVIDQRAVDCWGMTEIANYEDVR